MTAWDYLKILAVIEAVNILGFVIFVLIIETIPDWFRARRTRKEHP